MNNGTNEMTDTKTEMAFCVFCGKQIKAGARFCPACGGEQKRPGIEVRNPPAGSVSFSPKRDGDISAAPQNRKRVLPVWALIGIIVLALGLGAGGYAIISSLSSNESRISDRKRDREDEEETKEQGSKKDKSSENDNSKVTEDAKYKTFESNFRTITSAITMYQAAHRGEYPVGSEADIQDALLPYLHISNWLKIFSNPPGAKYEFSDSTSNATFQLTATYTDGYGETHVLTFPER